MTNEEKELLKNPLFKDIVCKFMSSFLKGENNLDEFINKNTKPEWTILSFKGNNSNYLYTLIYPDRDLYSRVDALSAFTLEEMFNNKLVNASIYSVRRESDQEVFTIGDNTNHGKITKFVLINDIIMVEHDDYKEKDRWNLCIEELFYKKKQSLFTTEDGVDIFKEDSYWFINTKGDYSLFKLPMANCDTTQSDNISGIKNFSTEKAAQEYIIKNKPCLSLKDIYKITDVEAMFNNTNRELTLTKSTLIEYIKQRLNLD